VDGISGERTHRLRLLVLGPFELSCDGEPVEVSSWPRRSASLFRLLATSKEGRRWRDDLLDTLWPDAAPEAAASNLRYALHRLHLPIDSGTVFLTRSASGWVMLNPTCTWEVDLQEFEQGMRTTGDDPAALERVMALYRGEPLIEDRYEEWAAPIRAHIERLWRDLCLRLADAHREHGSPGAALRWLECVLERDQLDEKALQELLRTLGELGRRTDALRRFRVFQESLQNELDITPAAETLALVERLRALGSRGPSQVQGTPGTPSPEPVEAAPPTEEPGAEPAVTEAPPATADVMEKSASAAPSAAPGARPSPGAAAGTPRVTKAQSLTSALRSAMVRHKKLLAPTAVALVVVLAIAVILVSRLAGTGHATAPPATAPPVTAPPVMGRVDPHWPLAGPAPGTLDKPEGMALDGADNLYVADSGNNRIDKFSSAGRFLGWFGSAGSGPGQLRRPVGVAVDGAGNVYVSDSGNDRIQKFSPRGTWLKPWGHRGVLEGQFGSPQGIAVDNAGDVLVADWGNNRVQELSPEGSVLAVWGTGAGPDLRHPRAVALDMLGNIYVADGGSSHRLHEFESNGIQIGNWGTPGFGAGQIRDPTGIAVAQNENIFVTQDSGVPVLQFEVSTHRRLAWQPRGVEIGAADGVAISPTGPVYIADPRASQVLKLSAAGNLENRLGRMQLSPAGFESPGAVAVDRKGDLYVADTGRQRVVELSPTGRPLAQLGSGEVGYPQALATDREGNLYVLDGANFRISRFSPGGRLLTSWGRFGTGARDFLTPQGIAVDSRYDVFVTDGRTNRVYKLIPLKRRA